MSPTDATDVLDILTEDHHAVLDLLDGIPAIPTADKRRDAADVVIAELVRHSVAEEMYVYPAMREHLEDGVETVRHDIAEHQELEKSLKALEGVAGDHDDFFPRLDRVHELLRHHAADEENTQFPKLRAALTPAVLAELGEKVRTAKELAPTRPHPASPHAELFHKAFGPASCPTPIRTAARPPVGRAGARPPTPR